MTTPYRFSAPRKAGKTPSAQSTSAGNFLTHESGLAALMPALQRIARMEAACRKHLATMFEHAHVLHVKGDTLTLSVPSSALATRLKQQVPSLLQKLMSDNFDITQIAIKIQPHVTEKIQPYVKQSAITDQALAAFNQLEQNMAHDKRNSELTQALRNLLARHGRQKV